VRFLTVRVCVFTFGKGRGTQSEAPYRERPLSALRLLAPAPELATRKM